MLTLLDQLRVWAAVTGVALVVMYFIALATGVSISSTLPMLVVGIAGFELFLFGQDLWLKRKGNHG